MTPRIITAAERAARKAQRKAGLGTQLQHIIHAGIDATPNAILSQQRKRAIKTCVGCQKRATAINRAEQKVRSLLGLSSSPSAPIPPTP